MRVHIGNHLYFENQRESRRVEGVGDEIQQRYFFFVVLLLFKLFASLGNFATLQLIPYKKPWWLSDIFCNTSAYSVKNLENKTKKKKKEQTKTKSVGSVFSFFLGLWPAILTNTALYILKSRCTCGKQHVLLSMHPVPQTGAEIGHQKTEKRKCTFLEKKMWNKNDQNCETK